MSFLVVKYTVNNKEQEKIFNANCKVINLLHAIREAADYTKDVELDIAEESTGLLQFLPANLQDYAHNVLTQPRAPYILVRTQKNEDGTTEYVPLAERANFLVKLKSTRSKSDRKRTGSDKKIKEDGSASSGEIIPNTPTAGTPPPAAPLPKSRSVKATKKSTNGKLDGTSEVPVGSARVPNSNDDVINAPSTASPPQVKKKASRKQEPT